LKGTREAHLVMSAAKQLETKEHDGGLIYDFIINIYVLLGFKHIYIKVMRDGNGHYSAMNYLFLLQALAMTMGYTKSRREVSSWLY
jgi:gamma-glutamylcyclotransferase (GGCT)/AIG2-like uncharacterized protein YtfP